MSVFRTLTENQKKTISFLEKTLQNGRICVGEVKRLASIEKISVKSLSTGRKFLKVLVFLGDDGKFYWELPTQNGEK